jgi:hypothetical protein
LSIIGIPFRRLIIKSPLSPDSLSNHLESIVWKHSPFFWIGSPPKDKQFIGSFSPNDFRLQKLYGFPKNIFKPTFYGTIEPHSSGSEIKITITLDPIELILIVAINLFLIYVSVISQNVFFVVVTIVFDILEYLIGFAPEARFFEKRFTEELNSINQEGKLISAP